MLLVYGSDEAVFHCRSTDAGAIFTKPQEAFRVSNMSLGMRRGPRISVAGKAVVVMVVRGQQGKGRDGDVLAWRSADDGATWQANVWVYRSPDGNVCECCHPSIMVSDDAVHVMFRNSLAGNRDMYVATSKDDGKTFVPAKKVGQGSWKLNACPMDGGMLAAGPKGSLVTV